MVLREEANCIGLKVLHGLAVIFDPMSSAKSRTVPSPTSQKIRATVCLIQYLPEYCILFHPSGSVLDSSSRDLQRQTS